MFMSGIVETSIGACRCLGSRFPVLACWHAVAAPQLVDHCSRLCRGLTCLPPSIMMNIFSRAPDPCDEALLEGVLIGCMTSMETALAAGANVNGSPKLPCPPIAAAAARDEVRMVSFLLERGADPNKPVKRELPPQRLAFTIMPGERALHIAANRSNVEIVRLLTEAGADPNLPDKNGGTPLLVVLGCCFVLPVCVKILRLLLDAGADPAQADKTGFVPMHVAAKHGRVKLVEMLHKAAPSASASGLNHVSADGRTPLFAASCEGHEAVVSRLLSLGARQRVDNRSLFPLGVATRKGFLGVVRLLLKDRMQAVGGTTVLPYALHMAVRHHQPKALRLLLNVEGEKKRKKWANALFDDRELIHYGVCLCCPAEVAVLLEAGADETSPCYGRIPRDDIGVDLGLQGLKMDRGKEVALRRIIEQGPAYRAVSWAWPPKEEDGDGCVDGGGAAPSSTPAAPKIPVGMRMFRPKSDRQQFLVGLVGRYCLNGYSTY